VLDEQIGDLGWRGLTPEIIILLGEGHKAVMELFPQRGLVKDGRPALVLSSNPCCSPTLPALQLSSHRSAQHANVH
jgi:hypothetical protein